MTNRFQTLLSNSTCATCDKPLSNVAFKFNLRHYSTEETQEVLGACIDGSRARRSFDGWEFDAFSVAEKFRSPLALVALYAIERRDLIQAGRGACRCPLPSPVFSTTHIIWLF